MICGLLKRFSERRSERAFAEYDRERFEAKLKEYRKEVRAARRRCLDQGDVQFVNSVSRFLAKKGFLTDRQISALRDVGNPDLYDDDFGFDPDWRD